MGTGMIGWNRLKMRLPGVVLAGVGAGVLVLGALGSSACGGASADNGAKLQATEDSFSIKLSAAQIASGKLTISDTNASATRHELVLIRTDSPQDQLPVQADGTADETGKVGEIQDFAGPKVTKSHTFTLQPGAYVLICNIGGHYQQGMHVALTVQ